MTFGALAKLLCGANRLFVVRDELASECLRAPGGGRLGRWIEQDQLHHHFISEKHWFDVSNSSLRVFER